MFNGSTFGGSKVSHQRMRTRLAEVRLDVYRKLRVFPVEITERRRLLDDAPVMDLEDIVERARHESYRDAGLAYIQFDRGICAAIKAFKGDQMFALDCSMAAKGYWDILGVEDFTQLAARWHCTKENVRKLVDRIQKFNGLPALPGQREAAGRENMSQSRKKQLRGLGKS